MNTPVAHMIKDSAGKISHIGDKSSMKSLSKYIEDNSDLSPSKIDKSNLEQWIPSEAMNVANEFRTNHGNDLSPELITELLRSLNKIWREREKK